MYGEGHWRESSLDKDLVTDMGVGLVRVRDPGEGHGHRSGSGKVSKEGYKRMFGSVKGSDKGLGSGSRSGKRYRE